MAIYPARDCAYRKTAFSRMGDQSQFAAFCEKVRFFMSLPWKKYHNLIALIVTLLILAVICVVASVSGADFSFAQTFWALLPPVVAIGLALITKEVFSSLFVGLLLGALMASDASFTGTMDTMIEDGLIAAIADSAGIFLFLVILGIIVALVNRAGASQAFGRWAETHIRSRVGAILATFLLGVLIFIDDYFNCLTVGSVMSPVTDSHRISRAKLAFLIDATAAPVCMIAPISSWAAAVSGSVSSLQNADGSPMLDVSGIELFVRAIPYNFYSLLTLAFILLLAFMGFDYGKMADFEIRAKSKGELGALDETVQAEPQSGEPAPSANGRVIDLILPVIVLIVACVIGLLYVGYRSLGWDAGFIDAFSETDAYVGLPWGSIIALILIMAYLIGRKILTFQDVMECVPKGFIAMVPAITILTLATALKNVTTILGAGAVVKDLVSGSAAAFTCFLPAIVFLVACLLAFATGTSWGTFGILIPIVVPIFVDSPLLFIGISACLAGAVCGDHCSPISDTTIMSSAGARCNHLDHVETQLPYAVTVAAVSFVSFLLAGVFSLIGIAWLSIPLSFLLLFATLLVIKHFARRRHGFSAAE